MAAKAITTRATLKDLPADFSLSFLKGPSISLKSRQQGFKYCAEEYYHDVKMFIDEDLTISCSARCYASYRTNDEPRTIHLDIKPTEISLAHCSCQAGSGETCSHLVGFITALSNWQLMGLTEVPAELPCTSLPQRWSIPRGTKIEPEAVPHMIFINPKPERKKRPIKNTLTDNRKVKVQEQDLEHLKGLENCPISYLVCNPEKTIDTHLGPVPVASGLSTHAVFFEPKDDVRVGTNCGNLVFPLAPLVDLKDQMDLDLSSISMSKDQCIQVEQNTREQANCPAWFEARRNKLTASNFGLILKRKKITEKFLDTILSPKEFTSAATSYGKNHEKRAIQKYINKTGNHVHDCGFVVNWKFPFMGASPDSKVCEDGATGILEVKCPYSARDITVREACSNPGFYMDFDNDSHLYKLKPEHNYYYQVQGQIMITGVEFCDFVVFTKKDLVVKRIFPDLDFIKNMLDDLSRFYCQHIRNRLPC